MAVNRKRELKRARRRTAGRGGVFDADGRVSREYGTMVEIMDAAFGWVRQEHAAGRMRGGLRMLLLGIQQRVAAAVMIDRSHPAACLESVEAWLNTPDALAHG